MRIMNKNYDDKTLLMGGVLFVVLSCIPVIGNMISNIVTSARNFTSKAFSGVTSNEKWGWKMASSPLLTPILTGIATSSSQAIFMNPLYFSFEV